MKKLVLVIITLFCVSQIIADGAKYLIIAPDNFVTVLQPLADWKTKKGVKAMIVPLSVTGNTALQIKNYILNAYNTWNPRPEYILLAGAGTRIPSWSFGSLYSDDPYADMSGNYRTELSIGRFPCTSVSQVNTIIAKIFSYERTPFFEDTSWYKKGTSVIREEGMAEYDTMYWNTARYIFGLWQSVGYTHIDSLARLRGNNNLDIESAINNGRIYIVYQGSAMTNWWSPFAVDTTRMYNGFKLPIIISASEALISMIYSGYLGDKMLNAGSMQNPKGAVGFFSTTIPASNSSILSKVTVARGFFSSVFSDGIYKLGDATKRAKYIVDSIHPVYYDTIRYREWNLYGDPELNLWTAVPKPLNVTYDSIITANPTNVTVTVMSNGVPVPNALVCLMKDTSIYVYGHTDNTGITVFSISPQDTGTISITVTGRNCHPFEGIIRVLPAGIEEITLPFGSAMTKRVKIFPNPCSKITEIYCNQNSDITIYDVQGRRQNLQLMPSDKNQKFILNLENLKAGVYMVVVKSGQDKVVAKLVRY